MSGGPMPPEAKAEKLGRVVDYPMREQLFVDIDSDEDFAQHAKLVEILRPVVPILAIAIAPSPSGTEGRKHVRIMLERPLVDHYERILLQVLLGSDVIREALSYVQAKNGEPNPCVFFELP